MKAASGLLAVAVLLAACTASGDPVTGAAAPTVVDGGLPDAENDIGDLVVITAEGVRPRQLFAIVNRPITFRNDTDANQQVTFVGGQPGSGDIPPGGTWSFTPDASVSIGYSTTANPDQQPAIQVEPEQAPGFG